MGRLQSFEHLASKAACLDIWQQQTSHSKAQLYPSDVDRIEKPPHHTSSEMMKLLKLLMKHACFHTDIKTCWLHKPSCSDLD